MDVNNHKFYVIHKCTFPSENNRKVANLLEAHRFKKFTLPSSSSLQTPPEEY